MGGQSGLVGINEFVTRQTKDSPFSYFDGNWYSLVTLVIEHFKEHRQGYRDGVILITVPPENFYSSVKQLNPGDELIGYYSSRVEGEEPRKHIYVVGNRFVGEKLPAKKVEIVLYRHDVLEEDGDYSTHSDWEIVSINASPDEQEMPIQPNTLIANHFHMDGGTETKMTDKEFVDALRVSTEYWKDKALVQGK